MHVFTLTWNLAKQNLWFLLFLLKLSIWSKTKSEQFKIKPSSNYLFEMLQRKKNANENYFTASMMFAGFLQCIKTVRFRGLEELPGRSRASNDQCTTNVVNVLCAGTHKEDTLRPLRNTKFHSSFFFFLVFWSEVHYLPDKKTWLWKLDT